MHADFGGDSGMVDKCIGQNSEMTSSADFNGPAFVCPLLLTGQTAVKLCIIKKKNQQTTLLRRNRLQSIGN